MWLKRVVSLDLGPPPPHPLFRPKGSNPVPPPHPAQGFQKLSSSHPPNSVGPLYEYPQSLGSPFCLDLSDAHSAGDWGKGRMGFGLNLVLFLVAGVRKGGEKEKDFRAGGLAQEAELCGGSCHSGAGLGGWRGNVEKTHDWSLAVRKGNLGTRGSWVMEAEGGCPFIHKEGVR